MAASIIAHAIALVWIAGRAAAVPSVSPRAAPPHTAPAVAVPRQESPPLLVELIEPERPAPPARTSPPAPAPRPQVARTIGRPRPSAMVVRPAPAAASDAAPSAELPRTDGSGGGPGGAAPGRAGAASGTAGAEPTRLLERFPRVDMRVSEKLIAGFLAHETRHPPPPPPAINSAARAHDATIAELDVKLSSPAWRAVANPQEIADAEMDLESLQRERDDLTMKPIGDGRYRNDEETFTVDIAPDGTVAIHDKPAIAFDPTQLTFRFDTTDMIMRARGEDPYARAKLRFLDRTRDERAELGRRHRSEQLSKSAELMLANIDWLWSKTRDPARRREALFELWDDCAETGDAELLAGADAARRMVIDEIRMRLRGANAYTPEELARFNAHRTSTARFAPYDPPHPMTW
jgi:hypothetical protein